MNATELRTLVSGPRARRRSSIRMTPAYRRLRAQALHAKDTLADALDERSRSARRAATRGRRALEDGADRAAVLVRRAPVRSVGISFAAGAAAGAALAALVAHLLAREASRVATSE